MLTSMRSRRMPAFSTTASSLPKAETAWSIMRLAPFQSETSSPLATASPPLALISFTTCWAGPDIVALAGAVAAQVVHHHLGAMLGQHQAMLAADAARAAGHDRHPSFAQSCHCSLPFLACLAPAFLR